MRNINGMGGIMDDGSYIGGGCGICLNRGRAANSDGGLIKTIESTKRMVLTALLVMLPWNAYAGAERFPGVQEQLDGLVHADTLVDRSAAVDLPELYAAASPARETIPGLAEKIVSGTANLDVSAAGENAQSGVINQELASLDAAVDFGVSGHRQDPQPAPIVSLDAASLEVVDTGATRHVQNPQPVAVVSPEAASGDDDQGTRNYELMMPITDVAEKNETTGAVVAETGKKNEQVEDVSGSAVSNVVKDLPYAVLLAILALMSMIPIARRNG